MAKMNTYCRRNDSKDNPFIVRAPNKTEAARLLGRIDVEEVKYLKTVRRERSEITSDLLAAGDFQTIRRHG